MEDGADLRALAGLQCTHDETSPSRARPVSALSTPLWDHTDQPPLNIELVHGDAAARAVAPSHSHSHSHSLSLSLACLTLFASPPHTFSLFCPLTTFSHSPSSFPSSPPPFLSFPLLLSSLYGYHWKLARCRQLDADISSFSITVITTLISQPRSTPPNLP